ncbi:MAG: queuosine precursor transporter [Planctomycetota bacterium]
MAHGDSELGTPKTEAVYTALAALFVVVLVLTNIIGVKLFALFPEGRPSWLGGGDALTLTTGIITYPITFLLTDIVAEIWGRKRASFMVILGFGMSLLMLGLLFMARTLPPSPIWSNPSMGVETAEAMQHAFDVTFSTPHILLGASMTAYLVAQLFDVRLYHFWWGLTGGKHMWLRNNGSTAISQLVDTIIVNGIFLRWGLDMEWPVIWEIILTIYVCKLILAVIDTPLIYLGRYLLRSWFGLAHDDAPAHAPLA